MSERKVTRREALAGIGTATVGGLAGCSSQTDDDQSISAAYVHQSPITELGWTNTHHQARQRVDDELDWYTTSASEDIAPSEVSRVFRELASQGNDIVEATSFDYGDMAVSAAQENPDTFFDVSRLTPIDYEGDNVGFYMVRVDEIRFLIGAAAGLVTESDTIGIVASHPIGSVIQFINSTTLGAQQTNSDITTKVIYVDSWHDPTNEQEAAEALIEEEADVIMHMTDTATALNIAEREGVWGAGYSGAWSQADYTGDHFLVSGYYDWTPHYRATAEAAREGTLMDSSRFTFPDEHLNVYGLEEGGVTFDEWGENVPESVIEEVTTIREQYLDGEVEIWGGTEYADQSVIQRGAQESYVEGVEGEVP